MVLALEVCSLPEQVPNISFESIIRELLRRLGLNVDGIIPDQFFGLLIFHNLWEVLNGAFASCLLSTFAFILLFLGVNIWIVGIFKNSFLYSMDTWVLQTIYTSLRTVQLNANVILFAKKYSTQDIQFLQLQVLLWNSLTIISLKNQSLKYLVFPILISIGSMTYVSLSSACYDVSTSFHFPMLAFLQLLILYRVDQHQQMKFDYSKAIEVSITKESSLELVNTKCGVTDMIANAAHDLKTPLQSITLGLDNLERLLQDIHKSYGASVEPHVTAGLETIAALTVTSHLMSMTINRSIDHAILQQNLCLKPVLEAIPLVHHLSSVIDCVRVIQDRIPIILNVSDDCHHISVVTDNSWLRDNLLCVLTNAVKFTEKGQVLVRVGRRRSAAMIPVTDVIPASESQVYIEVEDCGQGSVEHIHRMLTNRVVEKNIAGGAGIGLSCLYHRTVALGGSCGAHARGDGKLGVVVWFSIPEHPFGCLGFTCKELCANVPVAALGSDTSRRDGVVDVPVAALGRDGVVDSEGGASWDPRDSLTTAIDDDVERHNNTKRVDSRQGNMKQCAAEKDTQQPTRVPLKDTQLDRIRVGKIPVVHSASSVSSALRLSIEQQQKGKLRVLVVDDSLMILKMIVKALRMEGLDVDQAVNGAAALSLLMTNHYDVVVMDIQMPVMDGIETVQRLRRYEEEKQNAIRSQIDISVHCGGQLLTRRLVLGMSACIDEGTREAALKAGMDHFIQKPFSLEHLKALLNY